MTSCDQPGNPHHVTVALRLAALAWLAMTLQEVLLYARPDPYGEPYVGIWYGYLAYALAYNLLGVMLVSAPMLALWLVRGGRRVPARLAAGMHGLQLGALVAVVVLDQIDNEVMRFMGVHLTYGLLRTYYRVNAWGGDMYRIILGDRGGPGIRGLDFGDQRLRLRRRLHVIVGVEQLP